MRGKVPFDPHIISYLKGGLCQYHGRILSAEATSLKKQATALKEETTTLKKELDRRAETITEKDSELAEMASLIQTLTKKLEQYEGAAKETP